MPQNYPVLFRDDLKVLATKKLILDGAGDEDTYFVETSEDLVDVVVGGVTTLILEPTVVTVVDDFKILNNMGGLMLAFQDGVTDPDAEPTITGFPIDEHNTFYIISQILPTDDQDVGPAVLIDSRRTSAAVLVGRDILGIATFGFPLVSVKSTGALYLKHGGIDHIEKNTFMTIGITIDQVASAAENEIFAVKQDGVAHGITDIAETRTYFDILERSGTAAGGFAVRGFTEATIGASIQGMGTVDDTDKDTGAVGYIELYAAKKDGTTIGAAGASANLVTMSNAGTTRFIFDAEGSAHADVEWIAFAEHDDGLMLQDLEALMIPSLFGKAMKYNRDFFEGVGILHGLRQEPNGMMRGMLNQTRLAMLHTGAISQMLKRIETLEAQLA